MASQVIHSANLYFKVQPYPSPGPKLNLSCYTTAVELSPSTEDVDIGTFCAPGLSEQGITTYTALAALLWEPALYDLLFPHLGKQIEVVVIPTPAVATEGITFMSRYAAMPWGRFEIGQRVEVELPLAVLTTPVWSTSITP